MEHIAHLLPDGFSDSIEHVCRAQFRKLSIDAALAEVRSFGVHVYIETLDVYSLPDEPFATHLLHEARHIGVKGRVRHATVVEERVVFFQLSLPDYPVDNALMRRIFLPDEEVSARCSFANCDVPLDRCMPKARSAEVAVSALYLNALIECVLLGRSLATRHVSSDQHKHPDADWPFRAVKTCEFRMPALPLGRNTHNIFAIVDHMPLLTSLTVLQSANSLVMQLRSCSCATSVASTG